jgi:fructokinase
LRPRFCAVRFWPMISKPCLMVGIGEILWDMLPGGKRLGGAPANFAYHAHALGARGIPVSRVGRDAAGKELLARLRAIGLSADAVASDRRRPTGTVDVELDSEGKPRYTIHSDVAWDHLRMSAPLRRLARDADAICYGTLGQRSRNSRAAIGDFIRSSRVGCLRILDVNLRQSFYGAGLIRRLLAESNVVKMNEEELPVVARLLGLRGTRITVMRRLAARYRLRLAALTRGAGGSILLAAGEVSENPGCRTRVADTVGAGDAFTAAMTIAFLRGEPLDRVNEYANRVASYVCSRMGATPPMPARLTAQRYFG